MFTMFFLRLLEESFEFLIIELLRQVADTKITIFLFVILGSNLYLLNMSDLTSHGSYPVIQPIQLITCCTGIIRGYPIENSSKFSDNSSSVELSIARHSIKGIPRDITCGLAEPFVVMRIVDVVLDDPCPKTERNMTLGAPNLVATVDFENRDGASWARFRVSFQRFYRLHIIGVASMRFGL
jgi:hypothetical protein